MRLLILGIALLLISAVFATYLAEAYTTSFQVATFAKATSMLLIIAGIVMLFIATNWKIGFAGIGGEWLLFTLSRPYWQKRLRRKQHFEAW